MKEIDLHGVRHRDVYKILEKHYMNDDVPLRSYHRKVIYNETDCYSNRNCIRFENQREDRQQRKDNSK